MKPELPIEERILSGLFLCSVEPNEVLQQLKPEWSEKASLPINEKLSFLSAERLTEDIFPFNDELGDGIEKNHSFFLT